MKFISKDMVLEFEISGTKIKTKPMSMASQADYLSIIADTSGVKSGESLEIQGKAYARRISDNKKILDEICLNHFVEIQDSNKTFKAKGGIEKALNEIADIMEYIQMIGTFYKLSTLSEDESKN